MTENGRLGVGSRLRLEDGVIAHVREVLSVTLAELHIGPEVYPPGSVMLRLHLDDGYNDRVWVLRPGTYTVVH